MGGKWEWEGTKGEEGENGMPRTVAGWGTRSQSKLRGGSRNMHGEIRIRNGGRKANTGPEVGRVKFPRPSPTSPPIASS